MNQAQGKLLLAARLILQGPLGTPELHLLLVCWIIGISLGVKSLERRAVVRRLGQALEDSPREVGNWR